MPPLRERGGRVAALIVCVATICYDYADEARSRRLWEIEAGTESIDAVHGITVPLLRDFPLLHQSARDA